MFLAKSSESYLNQAPFYINIFENIISGVQIEQKEYIDTAINDAKEIANESKSVLTIDNNHFFLITTLLTKYKERLVQLQKEKDFEIQTYNEILEILK